MKNLFTIFVFATKRLSAISVFALVAFAFSSQAVFAQSSLNVLPGGNSNFPVDLTADAWNAKTGYVEVVNTERANAAVILANPNIVQTDLALYTGYDRMLAYMQADLNADLPLDDIAGTNYKKVVRETPGDPVLKEMKPVEFNALYNTLVSKLSQH